MASNFCDRIKKRIIDKTLVFDALCFATLLDPRYKSLKFLPT